MKHAGQRFVALGIAMATALAMAQDVGMTFRGGAVVPDKDDEWDTGGGFDAGLVFWGSPNVGLWLGAGAQEWGVAEETVELVGGGWFVTGGRATVVPVGAAVLFRSDLGNGFALQAEGGLRYAVVDSHAEVEVWEPYRPGHMSVYEEPIEIDDTVLGIASLAIEYAAENWGLGVGAGYQWDLNEPDQTLFGQSIGDTSFSGALLFVTASVSFF